MTQLRIKTTGKRLLRKASRTPIGDYFEQLSDRAKGEKWIPKANRYRMDCTRQYQQDLSTTPPTVDHKSMTAYIAASGPGHVIDGWSLLGRAVDAALRFDPYTAIHLGYYAELRAAMGLLACEGIGILNNRHASVDSTGQVSVLPQAERWNPKTSKYDSFWAGTHAIVWPCLRHWTGLQKAVDLLDALFRPAGLSLSAWLSGLGGITSARPLAEKWFRAWGLDLAILDDDHESRNIASYRPSEFRLPPSIPIDDLLDYLNDMWLCFEPSGGGRFLTLEKHLLRRALLASSVAMPITSATLSTLGLPPTEIGPWLSVLNSSDEPRLFTEAECQEAIDDPRCHLQVISRAALLLAVSTCAVRQHLSTAGYTSHHLRFWWRRHGAVRGLWDDATVTDYPIDIWADVRDNLEDMSRWRLDHGAGLSHKRWRTDQSYLLQLLGSFDLIAVWGLTG